MVLYKIFSEPWSPRQWLHSLTVCVISCSMANVCKYAVYTLNHVTRIGGGCYRGESPG